MRNSAQRGKIRPLLVGDSAYPLSVWLMKPFKQTRTLSERQLRFNSALSQARVVIEQAYGILKGRWRCLYKAMEEKTSRVAITILACCVLHNICIDVGDPSPIDILGDDDNDMDQSLNGDVSPMRLMLEKKLWTIYQLRIVDKNRPGSLIFRLLKSFSLFSRKTSIVAQVCIHVHVNIP